MTIHELCRTEHLANVLRRMTFVDDSDYELNACTILGALHEFDQTEQRARTAALFNRIRAEIAGGCPPASVDDGDGSPAPPAKASGEPPPAHDSRRPVAANAARPLTTGRVRLFCQQVDCNYDASDSPAGVQAMRRHTRTDHGRDAIDAELVGRLPRSPK